MGRTPGSKRSNFSDREWPLSGGEWSPVSCSYSEIIITGHQDGTLKFWDASAGTLQILYKLKTAKIFDKPRTKSLDGSEEDPLAVQLVYICSESRRLCIAGASGHVILFKFRKSESTAEILCLEIPITYETFDDAEGSPGPDFEFGGGGGGSSARTGSTKPSDIGGDKVREDGRRLVLRVLTNLYLFIILG